MLITVTGAAGRLGREVVRDLLEHGHAVRSVDRTGTSAADISAGESVVADLGSSVAADDAVHGSDAVVHLAAIPDPKNDSAETVLAHNVTSAYNVINACAKQAIGRLVCASSQCATGTPYSPFIQPLAYLPVDEAYPGMPIDAYGLSKYLSESIAEQFSRAYGITVASLRFPAIWFAANFDLTTRARLNDRVQAAKSLWSYIDARDAASAVRMCVDAPDLSGHEVFNIAADTAFVEGDVRDCAREWYGKVDYHAEVAAHDSLLDTSKAARLLGFRARYRWTSSGVLDAGVTPVADVDHAPAGGRGCKAR
jgi:nucleoside-diphosphate-sugar epimerase